MAELMKHERDLLFDLSRNGGRRVYAHERTTAIGLEAAGWIRWYGVTSMYHVTEAGAAVVAEISRKEKP